MSGSAATSDLVRLALALLQTSAARNASQSVKSLVRVALLQAVAVLFVMAAVGCALAALLVYAAPILGASGVLLAGAGVFGVIALAALGLAWRAGQKRQRSPTVGSTGDASLAGAVNLFKRHKGLAVLVALLAGVFLGGEN